MRLMKWLWCRVVGHLRGKWVDDVWWLDFKDHPVPRWVTQESRSSYCLRCGKDMVLTMTCVTCGLSLDSCRAWRRNPGIAVPCCEWCDHHDSKGGSKS